MKHLTKLSVLLLAVLVISLCLFVAPEKAQAVTVFSGTCGENLTWELDDAGKLTISGTGAMDNWISSSNVPWDSVGGDIKTVEIQDGITSIGDEAFYDCGSLENITIPESVISIGNWAFYNCSSLTGVYITDLAAWCKIAFDGSYANPLWYAHNLYINGILTTEITIPNSVTAISDNAFEGCRSLKSITIPESVTSIGDYAFKDCDSLENITIPESVTSVGNWAFSACSNLQSIIIPHSITAISDSAFHNCSSLKSIIIPESVTSIGTCAFYNCSSLKSITIPKSVTSIGDKAFSNCSNLKSITIPKSVTAISDGAFQGCSNLQSIIIPQSITSIGDEAFYDCGSLENITIPESVTSIGDYAFKACGKLENITIPQSVTNISVGVFYNCSSLKSIIIPERVTSIGTCAFYNCSNLQSIIIPQSITSIGTCAFYNCSSLKSITIPEGVIIIAAWTFYGCSNLQSIIIPEGVTSIDEHAFNYCRSLENITIPQSVTSIGDWAFSSCGSLDHVAYTGTQSQWKGISIGYENSNLTGVTRHYETQFVNADNCMEHYVYCPVCDAFIFRSEKANSAHSYTDNLDVSCSYCDYIRTVTAISVSQLPVKLGYGLFENLDVTGGMIAISFSDGSASTMYMTVDMVTGFDNSVIGAQQLTVTYGSATAVFTVEVVAQMPDALELLTKPDRLSYMIGDAVDLTGLTLKSYYSQKESMVTAVDVIVQADLSSAGVKTATVSFQGISVTFDIYVHERRADDNWQIVDSSKYPQSNHNYSNSLNETKTFTYPGASALKITFNGSTKVESNYDYIYIYDGSGTQIAKYTGTTAAYKTLTIPGDTFQVKLTSDSSQTYYGYAFSSIKADMGTMYHPEVSLPGYAATCTQMGLTDGTACEICGEILIAQQEIPVIDHDWAVATCVLPETCTMCSVTQGEPLGHSGTWITLIAPSCAKEGSQMRLCYCGVSETKPIAKLAHNYMENICTLCGCIEAYGWALSADAEVNVVLEQDLYVDLNGYDLTGTMVLNGYKIYGMDSVTNTYTCDTMGSFNCVDENGNAIVPEGLYTHADAKRYITIETDNGYTFHRFYLGITTVSLVPNVTGFGYKAEFYGDEMVQRQVQSVGYNLWLTEECVVNRTKAGFQNSLTLRLQNFDVVHYGESPVNASVMLTLTDGTVIESGVTSMSMRNMVESIDAECSKYTSEQISAVQSMIEKHQTMAAWNIPNLTLPADVVIIRDTQSLSNTTINSDVYITSTGVATFNNVTINGNIYCYGRLTCSNVTVRNVYAYQYGTMLSCNAYDGIHGKVSGGISCDTLYIQDDALNYAFEKWGKQ